ncbi:hypothetical protein Tco_0886484 [Tanacetum coccineum]
MANLKYRDEHNKVGFLEKPKGSADYLQVLDFLRSSHISQLQLDDEGGVEDLPTADIYLGMDNMGYPTEGKLTFHKNKFSLQWRNSKQYHAFKLTSKMFANMRLNFHGDTMPLLATMLPPALPAIAGDSSREAEPTIPHTVTPPKMCRSGNMSGGITS